jgi:peptidoglycan/xylan/chitin deacetylase (PgdA/CDA1 family)
MNKLVIILILYCTASVFTTADAEETLDALSTPEEHTFRTELDRITVIDALATGSEYVVFAVPPTTLDAWATPNDIQKHRTVIDAKTGSFDALAVAGDEKITYRPYSGFTGGYGYGEKRIVILMYHRFSPAPTSKYEVSVDDFEWQMDYIDESGYEVISLHRFVEALNTHNPDLLPDHSIIITIDDGFECARRVAWPILEKHGFPFTICLYTNYINVGGRSMTWPELRELANDPLVTIASHSISHPNLGSKRRAASANYRSWLWQEIAGSKTILENGLGVDIDYFCWPYGSYNSECVNVAVSAGYKGLLTVNAGKNTMDTSPYALRRYGVYSGAPRSIFAKIILGKATYEEEYHFEYLGDAAEEFLIP